MANLPSWRDNLIPAVVLGSAQDLKSRPLYIRELDAQGLLCVECGFPLGKGVILVGTPDGYKTRPCAACAEYRYNLSRG